MGAIRARRFGCQIPQESAKRFGAIFRHGQQGPTARKEPNMNPNVAKYESTLPTTSPRARQMNGLYALKPWFTGRLKPIIDTAVAHNVSPDVFTAAGVVAAGAAGVAIAFGVWPLATLFLVLRLAGANLDGAVARARGVSRPWGFVLNEIGDRSSDMLTFAGLAVFAARLHRPRRNRPSRPLIPLARAALARTPP